MLGAQGYTLAATGSGMRGAGDKGALGIFGNAHISLQIGIIMIISDCIIILLAFVFVFTNIMFVIVWLCFVSSQ